jgi:hypothetical protein
LNISGFEGLIYFGLSLLLFLFVQRWLHRELQSVLLLITRKPALAIGLFSVLFFPGVLLHEFSHLIAAVILRVKTGRFSVIPRVMPDGKIRMGYVETAVTDPFRDTLIGTAPLISGLAVIATLGVSRLGLLALTIQAFNGQWGNFFNGIVSIPKLPDFWLWFYLAFTISSTMLPSNSDRRAWLPVILTVSGITILALLAGAGDWMLINIAPLVNQGLRMLAVIFGVSLIIHLGLVLPVWLFRMLLNKLTGYHVV